jgi:hypothetical protein
MAICSIPIGSTGSESSKSVSGSECGAEIDTQPTAQPPSDTLPSDCILQAVRTQHHYVVSIPEVWNRNVHALAYSEQDAIDIVHRDIQSGRLEVSGTHNLEFGYEMSRDWWSATPSE